MEFFVFSIIALAVLIGFWVFIIHQIRLQFTKKGQRAVIKDARRRQLRQGMRHAEITEGLDEEIIQEEVERRMRLQEKQMRRQGGR